MLEMNTKMNCLCINRYFMTILLSIMLVGSGYAGDYDFDTDGNVQFGWKLKDGVGTYTVAGSRIYGEVETVDANPLYAILTLKGWSTVANTNYYAYAPYTTRYVTEGHEITSLPISYSGQHQVRNDDASHLSAYDFMMARYTTGDTTADIQLRHLGCIVRMEWRLDKGASFKSLTLASNEPLFMTDATMSLPAQSVTPTSMSSTFSLNLEGVSTGDGQSLVTYMIIYPLDITGKSLKATLLTADGKEFETTIEGEQFIAGKSYNVVLGYAGCSGGEIVSPRSTTSTTPASTLYAPSVEASDFLHDDMHPLRGGTVTAVECVERERTENSLNADIFSLSGMRVTQTAKHGIYIRNGKKYLFNIEK